MKKFFILIFIAFSSHVFAALPTSQAFLAIVPEGIYQGSQDSGESCIVSVRSLTEANVQVKISNSTSIVNYEIIDGTDNRHYNIERKIFRQSSADSISAIGTILAENSQISVAVSNLNSNQMIEINCVISVK